MPRYAKEEWKVPDSRRGTLVTNKQALDCRSHTQIYSGATNRVDILVEHNWEVIDEMIDNPAEWESLRQAMSESDE